MAQVQVQQHFPLLASNSSPIAMNTGAGSQVFGTTPLYVGDLESNVTGNQLYDLFSQLGKVVSIRVCRDKTTWRSLGYAYVNYSNAQDAARALDKLNFTPLNGKPIRIMFCHRDPNIFKSGNANVFIKNLEKTIDNKGLQEVFSNFGNILSCKIATDPTGQSKGYGFVQFENKESAQNAIDRLNGMLMNDKPVFVGPFLRKQEREAAINQVKLNNVFIKNLPESLTEEELKNIFGEYGTITSVVVMRDGDGKSRCFGFVNFENADDAAQSIEALNGKKFDEKELYVGKAQTKSEREVELKGLFEGLNLYVKNLDNSIVDYKLREMFSEFGTVTSCKVMQDSNGASRGSGYVAFSTPEEAHRALAEMNGKVIANKTLYVALAQRKEDRRARMQARFPELLPVPMTPLMAPHMPMYSTGGLGMGHFYAQGPPAMIPPQPGYAYQQQFLPNLNGAPMRNFFMPMPFSMPMVQQHGQHPGGRPDEVGPIQQNQQPALLLQQQMTPTGCMYYYPPGSCNMPGIPILAAPYDMGARPEGEVALQKPMPSGDMATAFATSTPKYQRTTLGEILYPLVDQLDHNMAGKVTGMLLEMDQPEVLHLVESPKALEAKVPESIAVLRNVQQQQTINSPADQLASLSLNE
ncbi:hypothetical protein GIB67_021832 [Kingdonia uniflora]|uniref:Polyadenylate-binding protein n=1 Tax=Kingdonia uniflora TaxID=39325 RepID=A0A7J7P7B0_9MAGN|nr:hypothetical protein GIB67_021832 [Kingdonia uniflora]